MISLCRTPLFPFQQAELDAHWERPSWGYCWDPGTGKTLAALENAARLEAAGLIRGLVVVAPNGVHRNWATDEIPRHLAQELLERTQVLLWQTSRAGTRRHEEAVARFLAPLGTTQYRDFRIMLVSYDAVMTEGCGRAIRRLVDSRPCLLVLDESHRIKTADAKRTKRVLAMAPHAPYRRILTGTLVADKPFDVYTQVKFLDPEAWRRVGCGSNQAFKAQFGVWEQRFAARAGRFYPELLEYRNLDLMQRVVEGCCSRVRKEEVLGELPPKLYSRRYFELSPEQRRVYLELREEAMTLLAGGELVTAPLVITRMMRMQQVTSGYLPTDDGEGEPVPIGDANPRLRCLLELAEDLPHQAIVWAKYRRDVDLILEGLRAAGLTACRYDGACGDDEMAEAREAFRTGAAQFFVSNPAKGGEGLTLNEAKTMVFYSTGYKLSERLQAEDRAHRIGQEARLAVVDLVAMLDQDRPTLDRGILESLSRKRELAARVQGDEAREWLGLESG